MDEYDQYERNEQTPEAPEPTLQDSLQAQYDEACESEHLAQCMLQCYLSHLLRYFGELLLLRRRTLFRGVEGRAKSQLVTIIRSPGKGLPQG